MTLLTVISGDDLGAAVLCGINSPTSIVGSSDPNAPALLRIANQVGRELSRRHDWQRLKVDYTVPSLATEAQTALPADYDRFTPYSELWNRSLGQKYVGPVDDTRWGRMKGLGLTSVVPGAWRMIGGVINIYPAPTAGQTLAITYMSKNWVQPASGSNKSSFTLDTDTSLIDEELLKLGIIWSWKSNKGFDYAEFMDTHEREFERAASRDRGPQEAIVMGRGSNTPWPSTFYGTLTG